jgi:cytochrome c oxidase assembly protein subunit 16
MSDPWLEEYGVELMAAVDMEKLKDLTNQRFFRYGLPFIIFVLGGSVGLKEFTSLR